MTADRLTSTDSFDDRWVLDQNVSQLTSAFDGLPTGVTERARNETEQSYRLGQPIPSDVPGYGGLSQAKLFTKQALYLEALVAYGSQGTGGPGYSPSRILGRA